MHVPGIHGDAFFVGGVAAAASLPHAGDAGQDHAVFAEVFTVAFDFLGDDRARADEAHVAADDVPELRQFIEAGLSEKGPELCDARVMFELEVFLPLFAGLGVFLKVFLEGFLGVRDHRLELVTREHDTVLADALVRKDYMPLVVDGHDDGQGDENRRDQDAAKDCADEVKDALDEAVPAAREVVFHREHEDFFAEQQLSLDAGHRRADEVRHKRDIAHVRLNLLDKVLQALFFEAWGRDDDILDAGITDDFLSVGELTVEQELLRDFLGNRVVVDDAHDVIAIAEVHAEEAQHTLGRLACPDEDDRRVEQMGLFEEQSHEIAQAKDHEDHEDTEQAYVEARDDDAFLKKIKKRNAGHDAVEQCIEDFFRRIQQILHLGIDLRLR